MVENIFQSYTDEDSYSECIMKFYNSTIKRQRNLKWEQRT